MAGNDH